MIILASHLAAVRRRWRERLADLAVREVRDWASLTTAVARDAPSVVLLDVALPGLRGVARLTRLLRGHPSMRVVLLSGSPTEAEALEGLAVGARGYADRSLEPALVRKAVEMVQKGEIWAGRRLVARLVEELAATRLPAAVLPEAHRAVASLTRRQRDVAALVAGGAANKEIAAALRVSERTVKAHLTAIFRRLGVPDRLRLALLVNGAGGTGPAGGGSPATGRAPGGPGPTSSLRIDAAGP